jgi:phosphoglycolate phosphatase
MTPHLSSIKAVFFDLDDTLVNTMSPKWAQHKHIAKTYYGKTLEDEEIKLHWGKPLTELMQILYETSDVEKAISHNTAMRPHFPKMLFDSVLETLTLLRNTGKKLGLVTATTRSNVLYDFDRLLFPKELFEYVQTEEDTQHHKPDPRVFDPAMLWLQQHQIDPCETLYIGDHVNDMKAARGAGLHFIGVATGLYSIAEFEQHGAQALSHLAALLARISG